MTNVFIAPKIKVGFQKRDDTFTGQLAYIIYFDDKGKLRKEKSWESWRDKKIDPVEFDNAPMDGFTLNKDVKRYSGGWFSSNRTLIRVHDPRGFEFEVTTENLIGILMHTDCLRRGLTGQFVYAWVGTELVLLPTNSEEYQNAVKYTANLSKKVKAKELVPGVSYKTKREGDVIFMGKLNWYEYPGKYNCKGIRKESKVFVFTFDEGKTFVKKPSCEFLSYANSDQPVSNFAELMETFNKKSYANKIVKYEFRQVEFNPELHNKEHWPRLKRPSYFIGDNTTPGLFYETGVSVLTTNEYDTNGRYTKPIVSGYEYSRQSYYRNIGIKQETGEIIEIPPNSQPKSWGYNFYRKTPSYDLDHMTGQKLYDLYITFENGSERKIETSYTLTDESY